jgi:DNA-binding response OmpR family regulator
MPARSRVIAIDVDEASLASLRHALQGWQVEVATAAAHTQSPRAADLLVVGTGGNAKDVLELCRFLGSCPAWSPELREERTGGPEGDGPPVQSRTPLIVLVSPGQPDLVSALLEAGAHSCLVLPIHFKDVRNMLAHARAGNQPGRHTVNLERAQREDLWRDEGGEA